MTKIERVVKDVSDMLEFYKKIKKIGKKEKNPITKVEKQPVLR